MYLYFRPSFIRSVKRLGSDQKKTIGLTLEALEVYYSSDCNLNKAKEIVPRFFHKQLRKPYYEAGGEGRLRVIYTNHKSRVTIILFIALQAELKDEH